MQPGEHEICGPLHHRLHPPGARRSPPALFSPPGSNLGRHQRLQARVSFPALRLQDVASTRGARLGYAATASLCAAPAGGAHGYHRIHHHDDHLSRATSLGTSLGTSLAL
eukprot:6208120-Pleurochrysis_carterae.AAC.2